MGRSRVSAKTRVVWGIKFDEGGKALAQVAVLVMLALLQLAGLVALVVQAELVVLVSAGECW